ncbi:MAG: hypothetical protein IJY65_05325 [Clostridia bacterium]|nr:hypothetical protein [Clostridia bacterium]
MRYESVNLAAGVETLVVALCLDYERREEAMRVGSVSHRTDMEYRYLNFKIYDAAAEIVGERDACLFINEIGRKVGYAQSEIGAMSEAAYKIRKREVKVNIAKKLHLID